MLAKKGYSLTRIADDLGLRGPQGVHQVLIRKYISARVEKRVAEITGIPLEKLFPDRYQRGGHSMSRSERLLHSSRASKTKSD